MLVSASGIIFPMAFAMVPVCLMLASASGIIFSMAFAMVPVCLMLASASGIIFPTMLLLVVHTTLPTFNTFTLRRLILIRRHGCCRNAIIIGGAIFICPGLL